MGKKKKFNIIVIAPPSDYEREIICDGMDFNAGAYYFYNIDQDNRRQIICYYPVDRTMIDSVEDIDQLKSLKSELGKIVNEVKGI